LSSHDQVPSVRRPAPLPDGVSQATIGVRGGLLRSGFEETAEALYLTSGYVYSSAAEAEKAFTGDIDRYVYSRYGNPTISMFEERLRLIEGAPAWDGNWTWDCFIAWFWQRDGDERRLVVVNYAGNQSQCYVRLPFSDMADRTVRMEDIMGSASFDRDGNDLISHGLYLDLPPWSYHVFQMTAS